MSYPYSSYGWYPVPEEVQASEPTGNPPLDSQTGRQDFQLDRMGFWGGFYPNGGTRNNPCGFPGYGALYHGTPITYRFMRKHPRIAQVRGQVWNTILSGEWSWEVKEGTPENQVELIKDMFEAQRRCVVNNSLYSLDYGVAMFEKVWEVRDGRYWLKESKPMSIDTTKILIDKDSGDFAGLRYGPQQSELDVRKCWKVTYGSEAGEHYGQSRLENIRETAWRDWLDAATELWLLSHKISGILPIITAPAGNFKDPDGNKHSWKANALETLKRLRDGCGVYFPSLSIPDNRSADNVAMAKVSLINIDVKDFGNHAPAIAGILERMAANEDLMFAGYLRSSRTGMQSKHGSRADAQEHTDTDTTDCEMIDGLIAEAFNEQVVDDVLVLNFGESARGTVKVTPGKLRDVHREMDMLILKGILDDPDMRPQFLEQVDIDAITQRRGIPSVGGKPIILEAVPADVTAETLTDSGGGDGEDESSTETKD